MKLKKRKFKDIVEKNAQQPELQVLPWDGCLDKEQILI